MGTIRYRKGDNAGLYDHESHLGHVFEDGSTHSGGLAAADAVRTPRWRAMCSCGWQGVAAEEEGTNGLGYGPGDIR